MTTAQLALAAALSAALLLAAVGLAVREIRGRIPDPAKPASRTAGRVARAKAQLPHAWRQRWRHLVLTAAVVAAVVWMWTGWPVHGLLAGAAILAAPFVLTSGADAKHRIELLEALAQWLNHLAGVHVAGVSLTQTVRAAAKNPPAPIAPQVRVLAERLRSGMDPHAAFARFADDLADGVVDHVVLLFQSHAVFKGAGLADALEALSTTIDQQAKDARDVESERGRVRKTSRIISVIILVVVTGCMLNDAWSGWYQSVLGQAVLVLLGAMFAGTLMWLRAKARTVPDPRLLNPLPARPDVATLNGAGTAVSGGAR